jgi:predicted membrane-bound spermidine synthase
MIRVIRTILAGGQGAGAPLRTRLDGASLLLRRNGAHLELVLGNVVLLSSAALETERAFGRLAAGAKNVLVGGLGFGATLGGVLEVAAPDARVVVAEKLHAVVDLARAEAAPFVGDALDDPRVEIVRADVAEVIARSHDLDAILLDVDNGPDWASFRANARLYADASLRTAREALRTGGLWAVWSGYPAEAFVARLRQAGFVPRTVPLHERGVVRARAYVGERR